MWSEEREELAMEYSKDSDVALFFDSQVIQRINIAKWKN